MKLTLNKRIGSVDVHLEVSATDDPYVDGMYNLVYRCVQATDVAITQLNKQFFEEWQAAQENEQVEE